MELLVILSYSKPAPGGFVTGTLWRTLTPYPDTTREDVLLWAIDQLPPEMAGATVTFFSAEPNALAGGGR
ncbi:hypothetical protein ACFY4C_41155 [Actinomadura viridis]|uniref:hypothetical protein n=1 Tax=Actinomadura viridis TaxID=58110 RepID=UPI0036B68E7C